MKTTTEQTTIESIKKETVRCRNEQLKYAPGIYHHSMIQFLIEDAEDAIISGDNQWMNEVLEKLQSVTLSS